MTGIRTEAPFVTAMPEPTGEPSEVYALHSVRLQSQYVPSSLVPGLGPRASPVPCLVVFAPAIGSFAPCAGLHRAPGAAQPQEPTPQDEEGAAPDDAAGTRQYNRSPRQGHDDPHLQVHRMASPSYGFPGRRGRTSLETQIKKTTMARLRWTVSGEPGGAVDHQGDRPPHQQTTASSRSQPTRGAGRQDATIPPPPRVNGPHTVRPAIGEVTGTPSS